MSFLLLLAVPPDSDTQKGTICFDKECTATTGTTIEVKPADVERRYVWTSSDAARVVLGVLAAKATSVDLAAKDAQAVTLSLRGDAQRGWPSETRFAVIAGRDASWRWVVPAKVTAKPLTIRMPRGNYSLMIAAEHHKSERRPLKVEGDVALPEITLAPLPVISGHVVTKKKDGDSEPKRVPVAGAQLARNDGKAVTSTNEQGAFRAELTEPLPTEIVITAPGFGMRAIPLRIFTAESDLGTIELSSGVKLTVHLDRPESLESKTLRAQLTARSRAQYENTVIASRELKPGENDLVFADLSEGEYYVTLSGSGPLERLTIAIPIKAEDVSQDVRIAPFQLAGSVRLGDDPVREGSIEIQDRHHSWRAETSIDGEGHFGGTMWQNEGLSGWVNSKATGGIPVSDVKLSGDPAVWDIRFPKRLITGRIFDEETRQPVSGAGLDMQLEVRARPGSPGASMNRLYSSVRVESDGSYTIVAVQDGTYDLKARGADYVGVTKTVEMSEGDESKTVDFPLGHGLEQVIEFVWPGGQPVAASPILEGTARDGHNAERMYATDAAGRLRLRLRRGETRTMVILPRDGSFGIAEVHAPEKPDAQPVQVVVPLPAASLKVRLDWNGRPPSFPPLSIRYNGRDLPGSVVSRLPVQPGEGAGMIRYRNLPAGAYELWMPGGTPVRVSLTAGEESVELAAQK